MLKVSHRQHGVKLLFIKILDKWGTIAHIYDDLGEDIYKNRVCVLTSCQGIIYEVVKICVYDLIFCVRIKEAPGWIPTFLSGGFKSGGRVNDDFCNNEEQGSIHSFQEKEECSLDPFGIYDILDKMNAEEANVLNLYAQESLWSDIANNI